LQLLKELSRFYRISTSSSDPTMDPPSIYLLYVKMIKRRSISRIVFYALLMTFITIFRHSKHLNIHVDVRWF